MNFNSMLCGISLMSLCSLSTFSQSDATFSDITIPGSFESLSLSLPSVDSAYTLQSGAAIFTLNKASWGGFTGFDVSRATDTVTNSWTNDKAAITGSGYGDDQYCIAYFASDYPTFPEVSMIYSIKIDNAINRHVLRNMKITNSTWTYRWIQDNIDTMVEFALDIKGYKDGMVLTSLPYIDLFKKTAEDTILINDWITVDLHAIRLADSITFQLISNHSWVPFYVAIDDIVLDTMNCAGLIDSSEVKDITKNSAIGVVHINDVWQNEIVQMAVDTNFTDTPAVGIVHTIVGTEYLFTDLDSSTDYAFHYRTMCIDSTWTEWQIDSFRTLGDNLSITNINDNTPFIVFPNPSKNYININGVAHEENEYTITDIHGRKLLYGVYKGNINIEQLLPGYYFITVTNRKTSFRESLSFIKE